MPGELLAAAHASTERVPALHSAQRLHQSIHRSSAGYQPHASLLGKHGSGRYCFMLWHLLKLHVQVHATDERSAGPEAYTAR